MATRPPVTDADGHILERQSDIRKYLKPPWNRRPTPLWPSDQPWDQNLFGTQGPEGYSPNMNPEEQLKTWLGVMEREGIETAVCFPTRSGRVTSLQERSFAAAVARACNDHFATDYNRHTDRIKVVGVLPLQDPSEAIKELRRAVTELGLISFEILSTGLPIPLGDPIYHPLYAEAERLGCPLAIHGTRTGAYELGTAGCRTFIEVHTYAFPATVMLHFTSILYNAVPPEIPEAALGVPRDRLHLAALLVGPHGRALGKEGGVRDPRAHQEAQRRGQAIAHVFHRGGGRDLVTPDH